MQAIEGVPRLSEGLNPATWMLQISTPGMERSMGVDYAQIYKDSTTFRFEFPNSKPLKRSTGLSKVMS